MPTTIARKDGDGDGKVADTRGRDVVPASDAETAGPPGGLGVRIDALRERLSRPMTAEEAAAVRAEAEALRSEATRSRATGQADAEADEDDPAAAAREEAEQKADDDREAADLFREGTVPEYADKLKAVADDSAERFDAVDLDVDDQYGTVNPSDYEPGGRLHEDDQTGAEAREAFDGDRQGAVETVRDGLGDAHAAVDDVLAEVRDELRAHADDFRGEAADYVDNAHDKPAARSVVAEGRRAFAAASSEALAAAKGLARQAKTRLSAEAKGRIDALRAMRLTLPPDPAGVAA